MWPWPVRWKLEDMLADVDDQELSDAKSATAAHAPDPIYAKLTYTESRPEWALLHKHIRGGQISPRALRRMRTADVEFVAGSADLSKALQRSGETGEALKILANVARARIELDRRRSIRVAVRSSRRSSSAEESVGLTASM